MSIDAAAGEALMPAEEHEPHAHAHASPVQHPLSTDASEDIKPKTPGSSRRGKQYKCGHCHELGHNQKTCPRRASSGGEAAAIQPALTVDAAELFGVASSVAPALPVTSNGHVPLAITRVQPAKLEAALEAANKRVMAADKQVAASSTDAEFEEATTQLDCAVRLFEKVASCAHRCAVVAQSLSGGWDPSVSVERDHKRIRLESAPSGALTPSTMAMNEAATVAASDAVDAGTEEGGEVVVSGEAKEEPLE